MNEIMIDIDQVLPNPWQPRESEDAEHIKALALSIAEDGLLQKPLGRLMSGPVPTDLEEALRGNSLEMLIRGGCRVQLAFGHSRLAAFKWLRGVQPHSDLGGDWSKMPMILRDITDEEMFRLAISENVQRKDLNAIEEARAMGRYRDEFGKTSAEIGALFGLSDSAVRNKMRLLSLPEDVAREMLEKNVPEHTGRELLFLFSLPEEFRQRADQGSFGWKPSQIVRKALDGASSSEVESWVNELLRNGYDMSECLWKHDEVFEDAEVRSPACKDCAFRVMREKRQWCLDRACYNRKMRSKKAEYLEWAALASGIPTGEYDGPEYGRNEFQKYREIDRAGFDLAQAARCENLRLGYDSHANDSYDYQIEGFPKAIIYCQKRSGACTCRQAAEAREKFEREEQRKAAAHPVESPEPTGMRLGYVAPDGSETVDRVIPTAAAPITFKDIEEEARSARREKRENTENVKLMRQEVARRVGAELKTRNRGAWLEAAKVYFGYGWEKYDLSSWEAIMEAFAVKVADQAYQYYQEADPEKALKDFNALLARCGLEPLVSGVSTETEAR